MIAYGENIKVFCGNSNPEFAKTICKELGIDVFKAPNKQVTVTGMLVPVPSSSNLMTNYAVGTTNVPIVGFVGAAEDGMLKPFVNKEVQISGRQFKVENWKSPVIWLDEIDRAK